MNKTTMKGGRPQPAVVARLQRFLRRGAADQSGAAAVFFAVALLLLAPLTLGLVDVYMATTQRGQLLDALDTATLYVARSKETDPDKLNAMGLKVLNANLHLPSGQSVVSSSFELVDGRKIVSEAQITPPSFAPKFWNQNNLKANSEVTRNSVNLEVALVLDTTWSMNDEMDDLREAAEELVDLVVQDTQEPYYSKAALVPYAASVNAGSYADTVRGALRQPVTISGATAANPTVITTAADHNLVNGEKVLLSGLKMKKKTSGTATITTAEYTVTTIANQPKKFKLNLDLSSYKEYHSAGSAQCVAEGCKLFSFTNASNSTKRFWGRTCVTERVSSEQYTDAAPSTALVGRNYAGDSEGSLGSSNTGCGSAVIKPLSSSKTDLKAAIQGLQPYGFTAGQIGLAWGWYMVSPSWSTVWTGTGEAPSAYDAKDTVKVVVLMTDGEFNTGYCKGVISNDSTASQNADQIKCDATNGDPFDQAEQLCENIKAKGIVMYTVGFNISDNEDVTDLLAECASKPENAYLPDSGTDLKVAFKAIGQDINRLRISK